MRTSNVSTLVFAVSISAWLLAACGGRTRTGSERGDVDASANTDDDTDVDTDDDTDVAPGPSVDGGTAPSDGLALPPVAEQCRGAQLPLGDGLQQCASGIVHRVSIPVCDSEVPRDEVTAWPMPPGALSNADGGVAARPNLPFEYSDGTTTYVYECYSDQDCVDRDEGACVASHGPDSLRRSLCIAGCTVDEDCGSGRLCECASPVGHCVAAECSSDADCSAGELCARFSYADGCGESVGYACTSPDDLCRTSSDCGSQQCGFSADEGARRCQSPAPDRLACER